MLGPETHAHPAELMLALPAGHVVTAPVLLNGRLALGAFLGVGRYPIGSLRIVLAFLEPLFDEGTWCWEMVVQAAPKTEVVLALTVDGWHNLRQILLPHTAFDSKFTIRSRAPLQSLLVINKSPDQ
jgi:hypothetical protein